MFSGKTIFVSALDWGLGHATRSVPVIRELLRNNTVILGVTTSTDKIYSEEFPELERIQMPEYCIRYSIIFPVSIKLLLDWPRIKNIIDAEKSLLEKIIEEKKIDVVVSDSRYGLYTDKAHCILITHQVFLKAPFLNSIVQRTNKKFLNRFDEIWIPDYEDEKICLAGELSHGKHFHENVKYIGPQSRLVKNDFEKKYDYLILMSGPEPYLTQVTEAVVEKAKIASQKKFCLVTPSLKEYPGKNIETFHVPNKHLLSELIASAETVICRSGYSTLMDMHVMGKNNLILIPTRGQNEQEYLAEYWRKKNNSEIVEEKELKACAFNRLL